MIFDNADHNTATLDRKHTFHTLGGIHCISPGDAITYNYSIQRLKDLPTAKDMSDFGYFPQKIYEPTNESGLKSIKAANLTVKNDVNMKVEISKTDCCGYTQKII